MPARFPAEADPPARLASAAVDVVFYGVDWPVALPRRAIEPEVFGDPDDHLRLVAQVAKAASAKIDADVVAACCSPKSPWAQRFEAFRQVLATLRRHRIPLYVVDPDALVTPDDEASAEARCWDDGAFTRDRAMVLSALLDHVAEDARAAFLRPCPEPALSERVHARHLAEGPIESPWAEQEEAAARVSAASRSRVEAVLDRLWSATQAPALAWLAAGGRPEVLCERVEANDADPDEACLALTFEALPEAGRLAGWHLGVLRGTQPLNGCAGPFALAADPRPFPAVPPVGVAALARAGWFEARRHAFFMHRPLRRFLARAPREPVWTHARQHAAAQTPRTLADWLEAHHHAVMLGDIHRALETSICYAADLRAIAIRWSQEARQGRDRALFGRCADLYRRLVTQFDDRDGYAWEYLGFNLACADAAPEEVVAAYRRACDLEPDNPLYAGRLLGYRAAMGHDVRSEFAQMMSGYVARRHWRAVDYYAEAVLKGAGRPLAGVDAAAGLAQRAALIARWRPILLQSERLRSLVEPPGGEHPEDGMVARAT